MDFAERPWIPNSGWPITRGDLQSFYDDAAAAHEVPNWPAYDPASLVSPQREQLSDIHVQQRVLRHKIVYTRRPPMRWKQPLLKQARAGKLRCLLNAPALELVPNESGTAVSKLIIGAGRQTREVEANVFVIACGALETATLLLNSRHNGSAALGNGNDLVGRNLLDHPAGHFCKLRFQAPTVAPLLATQALNPDLSMSIALMQAPEHQQQHGGG